MASKPATKSRPKKLKNNDKEDLYDEDLALKQQLESYVEHVQDDDPRVQMLGLKNMKEEIRRATSSATSVPKPLKYLRPHYAKLKAYFETMPDSNQKTYLADILSVLAMTMSAEGKRESLKYRLLSGYTNVNCWGHEYLRNLAGEIPEGFAMCPYWDLDTGTALMGLVAEIVAFLMKHNAEPEAVDLLMEVEELELLVEHVDCTTYKRTCLYLTSISSYLPSPCDISALDIAYTIYMKFEDLVCALRVALRVDNMEYIMQIYTSTNDLLLKKQFSYICAHHVHLIDGRASVILGLDSARQNLATTFVNAFVNAGFGQDKLMIVPCESLSGGSSGSWPFRNKDNGKASATASLGMILLWDVDSGLAQIDKFLHSNDNNVVAGALLGVGIMNCGLRNDCDPALALLRDFIDKDDIIIKIGAILGLGVAYAGTNKDEISVVLANILVDSKSPLEVVVFSSITLGLIHVGSCDSDIAHRIILAMRECSKSELNEPLTRLLPVALGLLYLGRQDCVNPLAHVPKTFNEKINKYCDVTLLSLAYAGTGNVLKVQELLGYCEQHLEKGGVHQGPAVLGIALVAMAEELGLEMSIRSLEHLLQYGEQNIRRAVPFALGILCISNPKVNVIDTLSRLSHDTDSDVSLAAIISLGLIGAGTNNARIAVMLRNLSSYYCKEAGHLFCVRIALGLVHLGKGLLTLSPYHSDRMLLSPTALAGIVIVLHAFLDIRTIILGKYHYLLYILSLAIHPKMLMTVDENLKPLSVTVRVGQAVDVVGRAGRPKTITRFKTLSTPVLLQAGERAELATDKYIPLTQVLEGFVILKENPDYRGDHD